MPIIKSAIKRAKQTLKRRERNVGIKKNIKSAVKQLDGKPSSAALSKTQSELDKAVKKGLIKKNTAARRKSALARQAKNAGVKLSAAKVVKKTVVSPAKAVAKKPVVKKAPVAKAAPKAKATPAKKSSSAKKTAK
jgi:ribosomal protein S20